MSKEEEEKLPEFPGRAQQLATEIRRAPPTPSSVSRLVGPKLDDKSVASSHASSFSVSANPFMSILLHSAADNDESAVLLSHIIRETFPFAANIVQSILVDYVQPALNASMPKGLPVPYFTRIGIGDNTPSIDRIRVSRRKYSEHDMAAVVEADVSYDGKPDIEMTLSGIPFGVSHATLRGRVEVLLRPLLDRVPLIGASQVAFVNRPTLDFTLTGLAAMGNQSLIRGIVRKVVEDVLADSAVLPNRVAFKCAPELDYFQYSAQPVGVLRVAALRATGFPSTDRNRLKQAVGICEQPDAYLTLTHGSKVVQTEPIYDAADPVFENEVFDFVLTSESPAQLLTIEAYDYDFGINNDDFLGRASVLVNELVRNGTSEVPLHDSPENAKPVLMLAAKELHLSSDLRHLQHAIMSQRSDKIRPSSCSSLLLTVEIDEAHNLPTGKRPYVRVRVGSQVANTSAARSVENPKFEESFHLSLREEVDATAKIEYEALDFFSGECLGYAFCSVAEAVEAGPVGKTYKFALTRAQRANASLRVRVRLQAVIEDPPLWRQLAAPGAEEVGE